ncbi:hypothetical protein SKAU_G00035520 [Synaphobranchus kaupii]|uniref:DUF4939 domain-containing protein n=1 Tax=Synaphobranchus kaupii TaxID=118154 RepID=A0A9Q1GEP3_SYNKA|nr:hypothetical protein SKAU_G00035520 [Synaphobranchus kaupii]
MTRLRMGHCGLAGGLVRESHLPSCECYDGRLGKCQRFLIECSLAFELQPSSFPTNRSKVALIIFLFSGKALDWARRGRHQSAKTSTLSPMSYLPSLSRLFKGRRLLFKKD